MPDFPQTPEAVALALLRHIAEAEGKASGASPSFGGYGGKADKQWILDTYRECLAAVRPLPTLNLLSPEQPTEQAAGQPAASPD